MNDQLTLENLKTEFAELVDLGEYSYAQEILHKIETLEKTIKNVATTILSYT